MGCGYEGEMDTGHGDEVVNCSLVFICVCLSLEMSTRVPLL